MDIYNEYNKIDNHIKISILLHNINLKGKLIRSIIEDKKHIRIKTSGAYVFLLDIDTIYNVLVDVTNTKRFNKLRLFFCMQYYLDELLFKEVKNIDCFYIEDESYKLTDLYFNQSQWISSNLEIIELSDDKFLNTIEANYLQSYIVEYLDFITNVLIYIEKLENTNYIKRKLKNIFNRIKNKLSLMNDVLLKIIEENILK